MSDWQWYQRKGQILARPYVMGEDLGGVSVSAEDIPAEGGMIAQNSENPADQWYIAPKYFAKNYKT